MKILNNHFSTIFYIIIINLIIISRVDINSPIIDSFINFHEGEYLGLIWDILEFKNKNKDFPIIIHGMMDFIPQLLAYYFGSIDYLISNTRIINLIIVNLTHTLFFLIIYEFTKYVKNQEVFLLFNFILIYSLTRLINSPLSASMSFLGLREFLIICFIYLSLKSYSSNNNLKNIYTLLVPIFFVFSLFWSYNRSPLSITLFIIYNIYLYNINLFKNIIYNIILFFLTVFLLDYIHITGSIFEHSNNFLYFLTYGNELWYKPDLYKPGVIEYLIIFYITVISILSIIELFKNKNEKFIFYTIILIIFNFLMIKIVLARPGGLNTHWFFWPLIILSFNYFTTLDLSLLNKVNQILELVKDNINLFLLSLTLYTIINFNYNFIQPIDVSRKSFITKLKDTSLVNESYNLNHSFFNNLNLNCHYQISNDGIFSLLSKKTSCSDFPYSAQIAFNQQEKVIKYIQYNNPDLIIMETPNGTKYIDNIDMIYKIPNIYNYLINNYPIENKINNFLFRSKEAVYVNSINSGKLLFTTSSNFKNYVKQGLFDSEENYAWSSGNMTEFDFSLFKNDKPTNYILKFSVEPFLIANKLEQQSFEVYINDELIKNYVYSKNITTTNEVIPIPIKFTSKENNPTQKLNIKFKYLNATSPADLKISNDGRKIALKFRSLEILRQ